MDHLLDRTDGALGGAASVSTPSAPISLEHPATSAASTAANLRSTRPPVTELARLHSKLHHQSMGVAFLPEHLEPDYSRKAISALSNFRPTLWVSSAVRCLPFTESDFRAATK
jgi:hypothetical protein